LCARHESWRVGRQAQGSAGHRQELGQAQPVCVAGVHGMNPHDLDNAMAGDYVMGLLDGAQHAAAEQRLATDLSFAQAVSAWRARLADLDLTAEEIPPSPALWP